MTAAAQHPELAKGDDYPLVELKRFPNNEMGVLLDFMVPPELKAMLGVDVLGFNIEPKRALRLCERLRDALDALGLVEFLKKGAGRYSVNPLDLKALSDLRADNKRLRGLIARVETIRNSGQGDEPQTICPFCHAVRRYPSSHGNHAATCPAFTTTGEVR